MLPEKPKKDKWINAKDFSWFFEYDPCYGSTEEEWYSSPHTSNGMIMQALADEAERHGIEIVRCKDCKYYEETDSRVGTCLLTISGAEVDGFCAWGERRADE